MSNDFSAWIGRSETATDTLDAARTNALRAALGEAGPLACGDPLPLLHHWLYFWNVQPPAGLGPDGHPAKGGFLPPVPLPRRMWAGGRLRFERPLLVGDVATRTSTIRDVKAKSGKSGNLVFVTLEHCLSGPAGLAIIEEQDLVYREAAASPALPSAALPSAVLPSVGDTSRAADPLPVAHWQEQVMPDPVLLFRYSALTMNGHRIHYDRPYAVDEEAYPGLVVQGPLQATLLAAFAQRHLPGPVAGFEFRGQSPAVDGTALHLCGEPEPGGASLWSEQGGVRAMVATART